MCEGRLADVRLIAAEIRDNELIPAIKELSPDADMIDRAFIKGSHEKFHGKSKIWDRGKRGRSRSSVRLEKDIGFTDDRLCD